MKILLLLLLIIINISSWFVGSYILSFLKPGIWYSVPSVMSIIVFWGFFIFISISVYEEIK